LLCNKSNWIKETKKINITHDIANMTIVSEIFRMVWLFWSLILFNFFKFLFHILYDLFCSVIYYLSYLYFIIKLFLCIHSTHTYLIYHTQWYTHHNTIITFKDDIVEFHVKYYEILLFLNIWGFDNNVFFLSFLYCFLTHQEIYI